MEIPPFDEAIARLCARDSRYPPQAYLFLHEGLMFSLQEVKEKEGRTRQISGVELSDGLRRYALRQFGPLAMTVLARWNIHATRDFGELVFALLAAGLLGKTDEDKIEDFDHLFDFEDAFRKPFLPKPRARKPVPSRPALP